MSRTTLSLFGARRSAAAPATRAVQDCLSGLTPIERSAVEAMARKSGASHA